jgi:hypothetical protein
MTTATAGAVALSCAVGRLHILAANPSTGGAGGSRPKSEAALTLQWNPSHCPAGVETPAHRKGPWHDRRDHASPG